MSKSKALKLTLGFLSTALFFSIPNSIAHADSFTSAEQGVAGITAILDDKTDEQVQEAYDASVQIKEKSPYENLGVSTAKYVNVRKEASTDSEIVGKLYRGCAADILETLDGGWVKIKSGDVEGYIASEFLAIGEEAEKMVDEYATIYATVNTQTLYVREKPTTDSKILTSIPIGEKYVVTKRTKDWVQILYNSDDDTGEEYTGYVSMDYVKVDVVFKYAISIAEETRLRNEQIKAENAEKERKEAQKKAEIAEAKRKAEEAKNHSNHNGGKGNKNDDKDDDKPSGHGTAKGNEIASYALKFVGNSYHWGGTSLTHGTDCSGFVQSVYEDFGYSIPRTSRDQAASAGRIVSESNMQPGDLIFYAHNGRVHHVAMYIGNGKIVHAANKRQGIIVSQYNYNDVYRVRRIVD